jgi:hypothetical protein
MAKPKPARRATRKCRRCDTLQSVNLFRGSGRICKLCEAEAKASGDTKIHDWAHAYDKHMRQHIGRARGRLGHYSGSLTPACLRALMLSQHGSCAFSHVRICLPPEERLFAAKATLKGWLKEITEEQLSRTPALVRVINSGSWEPGNVIFIVKFLEPFYTAMNGGYGMQQLAKTIHDAKLKIPQQSRLDEIIRKGI